VRRHSATLPATSTTLTFTIETAYLPAGMYTLCLQAGTATIARRVVMQ
jgi:hypothetical protein